MRFIIQVRRLAVAFLLDSLLSKQSGSLQKSPERGKPLRPVGSRTFRPPKKPHALVRKVRKVIIW